MKRWLKVVLGALGALAAIVTLGGVALEWAARGMCGSTFLSEAISPDSARKVVVYEFDCGATTGFATHVSLLTRNARLGSAPGNLFVADTDHGRAPAGPGGGPAVSVHWRSVTEVEVRHDPRARTFVADTLVDGVRVRYVQISAGGV